MADKKNEKIDFEDAIFRLLWDSFNVPEGIKIDPKKQFPKTALPKLYELTKNSRSFNSFRNDIINYLQELDKKGLEDEELNSAIAFYSNAYGNPQEGKTFTKELFPPYSSLKMRQIVDDENGADGLPVDEVLEQADKIYTALRTDNEKLNEVFVPKEEDYFKYLDNGKFDEKKFARQAIKEYIKSRNLSTPEKDRIERELDIRPGNDEYLNNYISSVLLRASKIGNDAKRRQEHPIASKIGDFLTEYSLSKQEKGLEPNAVDYISDLGPLIIPSVGMFGKANKAESVVNGIGKQIKPAAKVSGLGALLRYGHDIADSALTKHVFSDTPGQEISKRGDVSAALGKWDEALANFAAGLPFATLFGTIGGRRKDIGSQILQFGRNGLNALFGGKKRKAAMESAEKASESLKKQIGAIRKEQDAIEALTKKTKLDKQALKSYESVAELLRSKRASALEKLSELRKKDRLVNNRIDNAVKYLYLKDLSSRTSRNKTATGYPIINSIFGTTYPHLEPQAPEQHHK